MKIYLTDQSKHFPEHLEFLKKQPVMKYDKAGLIEKTTVIPVNTNKELHELDTRFLFDYEIFPSSIMTFLTQWHLEKRNMQVGDTIVQQVFVPPFRKFSQKIIFGVRINDIVNEPTRIGFSYETLKGHVEKGISTFTVEKTGDFGLSFQVHTFSMPGNLLSNLVGPIFSVPYQTYCTGQGLANWKNHEGGLCMYLLVR